MKVNRLQPNRIGSISIRYGEQDIVIQPLDSRTDIAKRIFALLIQFLQIFRTELVLGLNE